MDLTLVLAALLFSLGSGVPGLFLSRRSLSAQRIAAGSMVLAMVCGLAGATLGFGRPPSETWVLAWPSTGTSLVGLDGLSAFFLVPVFLMGGLGSLYGLGYWSRQHHRDGRKLELFWGALVAGMALLVIARNALAFLLGWELMALSAFFLVATEDKKPEARRASLVYLIAAHIGTLTLFALFTVWQAATGSYDLVPPTALIEVGTLHLMFFLALLGFGLKAGAFPLHFWLPGAHANAPTHVSAMLSGVVLKMGVYGLVRFLFLLPEPPLLWGMVILILGGVSTLFGVVFALAQHDLKRLLAYHSVENIGIIFLGLGLALVGQASHQPLMVVLGLAGCLLHVWNHSLFKSLLFMAAGSVLQATGTRQLDRLGGLGRTMPWTAALFFVGATAIVGLPPLNGFISELLLYLGFFGTLVPPDESNQFLALGVPVLAMAGALALACFVKVFGTVFLGSPRTPWASQAHEASPSMVVSMVALAVGCLVIGTVPSLVVPLLDTALGACLLNPRLASVASVSPLGPVGILALVLLGTATIVFGILSLGRRARVPTWDCGYAQPTARMQYTASSYAQTLVGLFSWILKPRGTEEHQVNDLVLDRLLTPIARKLGRRALWFHRFQQGMAQSYIGYMLATLLVLLAFLVPFGDLFSRMWAR